MATDFLGQTLNIGDDVIFLNYNRTSADLERGKITKVFPHAAEIGMKRRAEYKIVKIFADVDPVVHGRWVSVAGKRDRICSRCLRNEPYKNADDDAEVFEFCPHCGAMMDGGDGDAGNQR